MIPNPNNHPFINELNEMVDEPIPIEVQKVKQEPKSIKDMMAEFFNNQNFKNEE